MCVCYCSAVKILMFDAYIFFVCLFLGVHTCRKVMYTYVCVCVKKRVSYRRAVSLLSVRDRSRTEGCVTTDLYCCKSVGITPLSLCVFGVATRRVYGGRPILRWPRADALLRYRRNTEAISRERDKTLMASTLHSIARAASVRPPVHRPGIYLHPPSSSTLLTSTTTSSECL